MADLVVINKVCLLMCLNLLSSSGHFHSMVCGKTFTIGWFSELATVFVFCFMFLFVAAFSFLLIKLSSLFFLYAQTASVTYLFEHGLRKVPMHFSLLFTPNALQKFVKPDIRISFYLFSFIFLVYSTSA